MITDIFLECNREYGPLCDINLTKIYHRHILVIENIYFSIIEEGVCIAAYEGRY